jgi:hypothetical protein
MGVKMSKHFIPLGNLAPGQAAINAGDQIKMDLFGVAYEHTATAFDLDGFDIEIKPRYRSTSSPSPVHMVNSWGEPSGDVWIPEDDKDEICPDCKGKGVIELFNSVERCSCQNE